MRHITFTFRLHQLHTFLRASLVICCRDIRMPDTPVLSESVPSGGMQGGERPFKVRCLFRTMVGTSVMDHVLLVVAQITKSFD